ncbi:MAG: hypothetical protein ABI379_04360 [Rhodanobacter sp.]
MLCTDYIAKLEPGHLLAQFLANPPVRLHAERMRCGVPTSVALFGLPTTLEDAVRRRIVRLPG